MASKKFYHDIDLVNVGQLRGARLQNVTDAEQTALAAVLGADNSGLAVYNVDQGQIFVWNGADFDPIQIDLAGDVVFRGVIADPASADASVQLVSGYQYVVAADGLLSLTGVTIVGDTNLDGLVEVQAGDMVLFVDVAGTGADVPGAQSTVADTAYVIQRNSEQATEAALGLVRLASAQEAIDGIDALKAVTPLTLQAKFDAFKVARVYFATVSTLADTPLQISHGLTLQDQDAFTINAMQAGEQVSLEVDSIDEDTITVTSSVDLVDAKITIVGY